MLLTQNEAQHIIDNFELLSNIAMKYLEYTNKEQCLRDLKTFRKFPLVSWYPNRGQILQRVVHSDLSTHFPMWAMGKNGDRNLGYKIEYIQNNRVRRMVDGVGDTMDINELMKDYCNLNGSPIEFPSEIIAIDRRESSKVPYFTGI